MDLASLAQLGGRAGGLGRFSYMPTVTGMTEATMESALGGLRTNRERQ